MLLDCLHVFMVNLGETGGECEFDGYAESNRCLDVSRDDYESLPKHMKSLVPWEVLLLCLFVLHWLVSIDIFFANHSFILHMIYF